MGISYDISCWQFNISLSFLSESFSLTALWYGQRLTLSAVAKPSRVVFIILVLLAPYLPHYPDAGETSDCDIHHTRKLPRGYPNPHDAFPNRASTLLGPSSLGGVPLSPPHLLSARSVCITEGGARAHYRRSWRTARRLSYLMFRI